MHVDPHRNRAKYNNQGYCPRVRAQCDSCGVAVQVLRFFLRFPAEMRARITRAAERAADPSSDDAQAEAFLLGHDKVRRGCRLRKTSRLTWSVSWQQATALRSMRSVIWGGAFWLAAVPTQLSMPGSARVAFALSTQSSAFMIRG